MDVTRPGAPRLEPVPEADRTDEQRELLAPFAGAELNVFTTLARHPRLTRRWLGFAGKLLQGSGLDPREREIVILRVAWNTRARYEWAQHVGMARAAGLSDEEMRRVAATPAGGGEGWSEGDATLLRAVDELHRDDCVSDETWAALRARYDEAQVIELLMLAGNYAMLAGVLNSLGVQPEREDMPQLGEVP